MFFEALEAQIIAALQGIFNQFGWWGVAGMMIFENATGITPSEIILGLAGWMLVANHGLPITFSFIGGFYAAVGSLIGASVPYWAARIGGRPLIDRLARWVRVDAAHIERAEQQFHRWGPGIVFFGRVIPGIRTLVSIPAGLARMSFGRFAAATFFGAYLWCTLLTAVGFLLGHEYAKISTFLHAYAPWVLAAAATAGLAALGFILLRRRQRGFLISTLSEAEPGD